jgi:hypothetical protein
MKGSQLTSITARRRAESHRFLAKQQCSIELCFGQGRRSNRKLAGLSRGPFGSRSVPLVPGRNPQDQQCQEEYRKGRTECAKYALRSALALSLSDGRPTCGEQLLRRWAKAKFRGVRTGAPALSLSQFHIIE